MIFISKLKYYSTEQLAEFFLEQGKEGECWDFKQEWHEKTADLIKDIVCFANTVHDEDCYLIFGVSDDLKIKGMKKNRIKQADILDTISNIQFAGDICPKIEVKTISLEGEEIDVLIIFNIEKTPIYLKKQYGQMKPGCIYTRVGDKNTPDNGNADMLEIENLWRKRFGLTKSTLETIFERMNNKLEWNEFENIFYNIYRPDYVIEIINDEDKLEAEHYAYALTNDSASYEMLNIKHQNTIMKSFQLVTLDGGRLRIPVPEWGFIHEKNCRISTLCSYKYYVIQSERYTLLSFLYDKQNHEESYALSKLKKVILFFETENEKNEYEKYLNCHQELFVEKNKLTDKYNYIDAGDEKKTKIYKERLNAGVVLNEILSEWRINKKAKEKKHEIK